MDGWMDGMGEKVTGRGIKIDLHGGIVQLIKLIKLLRVDVGIIRNALDCSLHALVEGDKSQGPTGFTTLIISRVFFRNPAWHHRSLSRLFPRAWTETRHQPQATCHLAPCACMAEQDSTDDTDQSRHRGHLSRA